MTFLRSSIFYGLLLGILACGSDSSGAKSDDPADEVGEQNDDAEEDDTEEEDSPSTASGSAKDAGGSATSAPKDAGGSTTSPPKDAGTSMPESRDSGSSTPADAGSAQLPDAGTQPDDGGAGNDLGGGFMFPDLFPATPDAGSSTSTPGSGARDPSGPCKDLMLFCFDPIDMFIFNAECFTCNGGKGCQGCAIPYAF